MTPPPPAVHPPKTPAGSCEQVYNSELGPFPEYLVVGPQPTSAIKASGNGSKIGTEVVYDSRIAMAADRVGRPDRCSNHPSHLPQHPDHAGRRSALPR